MKYVSSVLLFGLLGSTLVADKAPVQAQTTPVAQVKLRVELVDVTSQDQQEFFGADEFFALWVFSEMRDETYSQRLYRAKTHFGVSQPISIKKGERKTISAGKVIFDGVLSERSALSGSLRAMEEDESRKWSDAFRESLNAEVLGRIEADKSMRESTVNSDWRLATNKDLANWAASGWNNSVHRSNVGPYADIDDIIATTPFDVSASGAPVEERSWRAQGDGAVYVLRYRVTRTPVAAPSPVIKPPSLPQLPVSPPVPTPLTNLSTWVDEWQTTNGRVKLALENGVLRGQLFLKNMDGSDKEWDRLELRAGTVPGQLVGTATSGSLVTKVSMTLSADRQSFTATGQVPNQAPYNWSGKRVVKATTVQASPPMVPVTEPLLTPGTAPTQNTLPTAPATSTSEFLPMRTFGVRVDRVQPNIAGDRLEVYCTFKNLTEHNDNINGSMISAIVTDADGVSTMSDVAFYRPTGTPELMAGNREVQTQGELKARLLIDITPGTAPLKTLTLWETSSQPHTIDISNVQWRGAKPATDLPALKLSSGTTDFRGLNDTLAVRFDGYRKTRNTNYEAFFTVKNTSDALTRDAVLDLNRGSFKVFLNSEDGTQQPYNELARANGEGATPIVMHYAILPGGETHIRYTFSAKEDLTTPSKVSFTNNASPNALEWSLSAK